MTLEWSPGALVNNGFDDFCMWTGYETGNQASAERYQDPYIFASDGAKTYEGGFGPEIFTDFIVDFIHRKREEPFFVYFPMVLTHTPFVNTPDEEAEDNLGKHKAMVRYTDKLTGRIVKALEESKQLENTIIVWTSDNGTTRRIKGNYQGRLVKGGKSQLVEPGIASPFIVSWKGKIKEGQISEALIDFTDIYPTFLDFAGLRQDKNDAEIDGYSFKDVLLKNQSESLRSWIMSMGGGNNAKLTEEGVENQYNFRDRVIRNERYKLYIGTDRQPKKFVDLNEDVEEEFNLIGNLSADAKQNFDELLGVIEGQPLLDSDPRYEANPPQSWDVKITAQSSTWKQ